MKQRDFLIDLYDDLCEEYLILEDGFIKEPTSGKRNVLLLLKAEIYKIDRRLQER